MLDKPGCNDVFHYFRDEGQIRDCSVGCQMIRVQSTFLQTLLLTDWKNGTMEGCIAQAADDMNQNVLYLLGHPCRHRIKGAGFRWHTYENFV